MKRILVDVNVILDVLLERKPYAEASAAVWAAVEKGRIEGLLSAHAVMTIHYLVGKEKGVAGTKRILADILRVFGVAAVDGSVIQEALQSPCSDFEDAVAAAAARGAGCTSVVTRDPKGFRGSAVQAITPEMAIQLIGAP
jgi:predicted nucleic acid-binding protein